MASPDSIHWADALRNLSPDEIQLIEKHMSRRVLPAKCQVFSQGEIATELFILVSGRVRLVYYSPAGSFFTTGIWAEDYILGLVSTYLGGSRFLSAETVDPAEFNVLSRLHLLDLMRTIPQFSLNVAQVLAMQASDSMQRNGLLALDSVLVRLCRILLRVAQPSEEQTSGPDARVVAGLSQEELAGMVGSSRVWVNQALANLERRRLIERHKLLIVIRDVRQFRRSMLEDQTE